jgi:hypothetical protein
VPRIRRDANARGPKPDEFLAAVAATCPGLSQIGAFSFFPLSHTNSTIIRGRRIGHPRAAEVFGIMPRDRALSPRTFQHVGLNQSPEVAVAIWIALGLCAHLFWWLMLLGNRPLDAHWIFVCCVLAFPAAVLGPITFFFEWWLYWLTGPLPEIKR